MPAGPVIRRTVSTGTAADTRNPHSAGVIASGEFLFTSGITPRDETGAVVGAGDMAAQMERVFANLEDVLRAAGTDFTCTMKLTVYVTDIDAYRAARAARPELVEGVMAAAPALTLIEVSRLADPALMIEAEAITVLE